MDLRQGGGEEGSHQGRGRAVAQQRAGTGEPEDVGDLGCAGSADRAVHAGLPQGGRHAADRRHQVSAEAATEINAIDMGQLLLFLADHGFAAQVGSWVSAETPNQPLTGQQLLTVLDEQELQVVASEAGMSVLEYAEQLARELPEAANAVTPDGELPEDEEFRQHAVNFDKQ
nr:YidB family protein [Actinoalloteichus hymeniacidonis]